MAVEARSVDLFPTQIIANSDPIVKSPTPFLPSQTEDFIPLSMTETSEPIVRPKIIANSDPIVKSPTPFLPSQAEDFIPLSMTETSEPIVRPKRRRRQQLRIVPELSGVKPSGKADGGSSCNCSIAAFSVSRNHHKRSRDAIGDDHLTVNPSSRKMSKASPLQLPGAAANTLRSNLEHALARGCGDDDAESCGSNDPGSDGGDAAAESRSAQRWCRPCGERESSVLLLLPRRHIRLCAVRRADPATTTARRAARR